MTEAGSVKVGSRLLHLALESGSHAISVVGTAKGAGKTTAMLAIYEAAVNEGMRVAFASAGYRARLPLRGGTLFATARPMLPATPAAAIMRTSALQTPAGPLAYARTMHAGLFDTIGPSTATGLLEAIEVLAAQSDLVLVDGAVDRLAMLATSAGAIVIACGAAAASSEAEAVTEIAALTQRLRVPRADLDEESIAIATVLTAGMADDFIRNGEARQIVVDDPTQIALRGAGATRAFAALRLRCRTPFQVVATTVRALGPDRAFEPSRFLEAVARRTGLPAFDVFAGREAA